MKIKSIVFAVITSILTVNTAISATQTEIDNLRENGLAYLFTSQNANGYWPSGYSKISATATVLKAFHNAGISKGISIEVGLGWLANTHANNTVHLAEQAGTLGLFGYDVEEKLSELSDHKNSTLHEINNSAVWGTYPGYQPNIQVTSLAIDAWFLSDQSNADALYTQAVLVQLYQNTDNGWPYPGIVAAGISLNSELIPTAFATRALSRLRQQGIGSQTDITEGINWIIASANKKNDGGFNEESTASNGEIYETALVLSAIKAAQSAGNTTANSSAVQAVVSDAEDFLVSKQDPLNGSFVNDPLTTAFVLEAITQTVLLDSDTDGIPDNVELITGTNPQYPDAATLIDGQIGDSIAGYHTSETIDNMGRTLVSINDYLEGSRAVAIDRFEVSSGLPEGVSVDETSGLISGLPYIRGAFNFFYTVIYSDDVEESRNAKLVVTGDPGITIPTMPLPFLMLLGLFIMTIFTQLKKNVKSYVSLLLVTVLFSLSAGYPGILKAATPLPDHVLNAIKDSQIEHPAKRDDTLRLIQEEIHSIAKSMNDDFSLEAKKMFLQTNLTRLLNLNDLLNKELTGEKLRRYNKDIKLHLSEDKIKAKDQAIANLAEMISNLINDKGTQSYDAFIELKKVVDGLKPPINRGGYSPTIIKSQKKGKFLDKPPEINHHYNLPGYAEHNKKVFARTSLAMNGHEPLAFSKDGVLIASSQATLPDAQNCNYAQADLEADNQEIIISQEIQDKAKALGYDVRNIFNYVSNEIHYQPTYGALKGAVGTLKTGSGGSTDQASLTIALLRDSGIPARYVRGIVFTRTLDDPNHRILKWLQVESAEDAAQLLGSGENPDVGWGGEGYLQFSHVWVEACVPYSHYNGSGFDQVGHRWIPLDVSFENRQFTNVTAPSYDFDIDDYLSGYKKKTPEEYVAENVNDLIADPNLTVKDVGYQSTKVNVNFDILPNDIPIAIAQFTNWTNSGSSTTSILPDSHRYYFTAEAITSAGGSTGASFTVPTSSILLKPVTFHYKGATASAENTMSHWRINGGTLPDVSLVPQFLIDGVVVDTGTVITSSTSRNNKLNIRVTLDEAIDNQTNRENCPVVTETQLVNDSCFDGLFGANYHSLQFWGHQGTNKTLTDIANKTINAVNNVTNPGSDIHQTLGNFLHYMSLSYMTNLSNAPKVLAKAMDFRAESGLHLGLTGSQSYVEKVLDLPLGVVETGFYVDVPGGVSRSIGDTDNEFLAIGYTGSAYESELWRKGARMDAVSTASGIQYANEQGYGVYTITSANQGTELAKLRLAENGFTGEQAYPAGFRQFLIDLLNEGFTVKIPDRRILYGTWLGTVYTASKPSTASFAISGSYDGGFTVADRISMTTYNPTYDWGYNGGSTSSFLDPIDFTGPIVPDDAILQIGAGVGYGNSFASTFAGDPVNTVNGNYFETNDDLTIPFRDLPFVFQRSYNSRSKLEGPLGVGWTHSFNHALVFSDDNPDAQDSSDEDGTVSSVIWVNGTGAESQITVTGANANGTTTGSTFTAPQGQYYTVERLSAIEFKITEKNGLAYYFEPENPGDQYVSDVGDKFVLKRIESRNGNSLTLSYVNGNLDKVTDNSPLARFIQFSHDNNDRITAIEDWSGRRIEYVYDGNGDLVQFKNPLAVAGDQPPVIYEYFTDNDAETIAHSIKSITHPKGNGIRFEYYIDGRVFRHTNDANETFIFEYNDFRRETIVTDSRGNKVQYFFDELGNTVEMINEEGSISTYEYNDPDDPYLRTAMVDEVGLRTEYSYNNEGTVISQTNPSGSTITYSHFTDFEQPGKIKDANGNYQLRQYDSNGNLTDTIILKSGIGVSITPETYNPVDGQILSWTKNIYDSVGNLKNTKFVENIATEQGFVVRRIFDPNQLYPDREMRCGFRDKDRTDYGCDSQDVIYDELGRVEQGINGRFERTLFSYDELDRIVRASDSLGYVRDYTYDENNNPTGNSLSVTKVGKYFHVNRTIDGSIDDNPVPIGGYQNLTLYDSSVRQYDQVDRVKTTLDAAGNASFYTYDAMGNIESITDPDNYSIGFTYDKRNRVLSAFDEEGREAKRDVDAIGRTRKRTDPNGFSTTYQYYGSIEDGRLEKQCEPPALEGATPRCTTFDYDNNGNVTLIVDNAGNAIEVTYDALNRPVRIVEQSYTDALLGQVRRPVTTYTYDLLGNVTEVKAGSTDSLALVANDSTTVQETTVYDYWSRPLVITDPLNNERTFEYNQYGDPVKEYVYQEILTLQGTDSYVQTPIVRSFYYGGLLRQKDELQYRRNPLGQLIHAVGGHNGVSNNEYYEYDEAQRLTKITSSGGATKAMRYSPGGRLTSLVVKNGAGALYQDVDYRYDNTGRLQTITTFDTDSINYVYDDGGRLTEKHLPGGIKQRYTHYNDNRIASILIENATNNTLFEQVLTYDNLGRVDSIDENLNGANTQYSYTYDNLSRLTGETLGSQSQTWAYDAFGNRITHNHFDGVVDYYQYDDAHQLTTIRANNASGTAKAHYQYTPDGEALRSCVGSSAASVTSSNTIATQCDLRDYALTVHYNDGLPALRQTFTADGSNYLNSSFFLSGQANSSLRQYNEQMTYDHAGRRFKRTSTYQVNWSGSSWSPTLNSDDFGNIYSYVGEDIVFTNNGLVTNVLESIFINGGGIDEPLIRYSADFNTQSVYHQDYRNSAVIQTDLFSGTVTGTQQYDAFGNVNQISGQAIKQYGFTGREHDPNGLMHYRARVYNPKTGRFNSRDPLGFIDGVNRYAYVANNPVNNIDPFGTSLKNIISGVDAGSTTLDLFQPSYYDNAGFDPNDFNLPFPESDTMVNLSNGRGAGQAAQTLLPVGGALKIASPVIKPLTNKLDEIATVGVQKTKDLFGVGKPTKPNRGGVQQPYDPDTGRFLSYNENPGVKQSVGGRFTTGFAQGFGEATTNQSGLATPVGFAGQLGHALGTIAGSIVGVFGGGK